MRNSQKRTNFRERSCRRYKTERKRDIGFMSLLRMINHYVCVNENICNLRS